MVKINDNEHPSEIQNDFIKTSTFEEPENFDFKTTQYLGITKKNLTKHLFINGPQGTGKSYSFLKLVEEMVKVSED